MKKLNKILILMFCVLLILAMLSGCKTKKNQDDASILVNEGDIEIVVPDDQEIGGE